MYILEMIVEKGDDGHLNGRIQLGEDLVVSEGKDLTDLHDNMIEALSLNGIDEEKVYTIFTIKWETHEQSS